MATAALVLGLSACAPDLGEMPQPLDAARLAATESLKAPTADWPRDAWWKTYGDAELDTLIAEALADSPSLRVAAARMRAATAEAGIAGADLWPTINASGNAMEAEVSSNQMGKDQRSFMPKGWHHEAEMAAGLQYELDFFGKNRARLAAATSSAEAAAADEAAARLQISTAVASVYAQLVGLENDRRLATNAVRQRKESAELVRQRFRNGLENQGQISRAEAQVWSAETSLDTVDRLILLSRHQLAALLGKGPDRGLSIAVPEKVALKSAGLPANLSLDLIGRRPDIVAAKKRADAAAKAIDVANANFYPNVDLVGKFGVQSLDAEYLMTASSEFGSFGPAITLPIFDYGRLTGVYAKSRAEYDAAAAAYDATLTDALRDVADAYSNRRAVENEHKHARAMLASSQSAYDALKARYKAGISPYIDLLSAETQLIDQKRAVADFETQAFAYDVALVRALGGGYGAPKRNEHQEN
jgi:NodT family efflux transporter outer membrane factor (OMF) lipoprotein